MGRHVVPQASMSDIREHSSRQFQYALTIYNPNFPVVAHVAMFKGGFGESRDVMPRQQEGIWGLRFVKGGKWLRKGVTEVSAEKVSTGVDLL